MQPTTPSYEGYVPIPQARDIIKQMVPAIGRPSERFIRNAIKDGTVRAIRVGTHRLLVNADDVHGLRTQVDRNLEERIRELVTAAPEFNDELINRIRLILAASNGGEAS